MNVVLLHQTDIESSRDMIIDNIRENPVFVVTAKEELCDYIPMLELREKIQSRMCICKELKINVRLNKKNKSEPEQFTLLSELLKKIEPDKEECEVVVLGDDNVSEEQEMEVRYQLCAIIQQFIYMNIQLSKVQVCTEKEAKDNQKIRKFEKNIDKHKKALTDSVKRVTDFTGDYKNYKAIILEHLEKIQGYIEEIQNKELKIAVAATKKSGKSVIVNSMIECEMAPTSLELATPNNCIYRKSPDDKFHLKYKGKEYTNADSEVIRSRLNEIFKKAEKDYENGLGIPDMDLLYPCSKKGFSTYTIYDTPGPNLAKAKAHKEAAERGVDAADVIVFTIDYSNHLADDEYKYLKKVWNICKEKGKKYSLILNVNKLDLRYDNSSDKSIVRIVDFIRNKLISTGKADGIDFRDCVVIGTSALTYFNAVAAPALKCPTEDGDCRGLLKKFSIEEILTCIDSYDYGEYISIDYENRATAVLDQLKDMIGKSRTWHKQEISSIDDMKVFSGMPNLLSYVNYISTQKARNEKINNLMFKIDSEYTAIMNLFHIEELMQKLKDNKELLERVKMILREFNASVAAVLDDEYKDLHNNYQSICDENKDMSSMYMVELTKKLPIVFSDIKKMYSENVEKQLGLYSILNEVTEQRIDTELKRRLRAEYGVDNNKVLKIDSVCVTYERILADVSKNIMSGFVKQRKEEMGAYLQKEQNAISRTIAFIWSERLENLRNIIKRDSDKLVKECSEQLNIEVPEFQLVFNTKGFGSSINLSSLNTNTIDRVIESAMNELNRFEQGTKDGVIGWFNKLIGRQKQITLDNVLKIYSVHKIGIDLKGIYEKNGILEEYLKEIRNSLKDAMNKFIDNMNVDIKQLNDNISNVTAQIKESIDESEQYQQNIDKLEKEKQSLVTLKDAVSAFSDTWNEVITK